jgi:hypothetical protein
MRSTNNAASPAIKQAVGGGHPEGPPRCFRSNFFPDVITDPFADSERTMRVAKETGLPPERLMFEFAEHGPARRMPHGRDNRGRIARCICQDRVWTISDRAIVGLALLSRFTPGRDQARSRP